MTRMTRRHERQEMAREASRQARAGERPTFLWTRLHDAQVASSQCERCGARRDQHLRVEDPLDLRRHELCPEWALRAAWGDR